LHNIDFSYNDENKVLDAISMTINHGERIWIKGKNGTGKSTFCKIITGLYLPDQGSIQINSIDTGLYHPKALNKTIALISGKDMIFNDTLLFNITFGRKVDLEELIEYAKMVNLYEFINGKSEKFDYVIHENGSNLSTGQRRKILLLRAMFLDAEVIIFDEVFNGIDQESKERIEQLIDLIDHKTFILISHIPVNNIRLDKKYILKNGKFIHQNSDSN
jgi:subfamily B ATP-binding cassette protein HlyB/CyaB